LKASIIKECDQCGEYYFGYIEGQKEIACSFCNEERIIVNSNDWPFKVCPFCDCAQFYKRKDFNQLIGCFIIIIGAIFVPFTFGLSLVILLILDYLLYKKVSEILVCYKCQTEFRNFGLIEKNIDQFNHHIAELYEH
tara:strand:- start:18424 stop:18834 length:411 start_codon:yes stop_codon:yes gene_type:complete